ncbi:MAG: hypothetical protein FD123_1686 [Bacteroidetes bacterium]|nr:MAG: hypothetical protein FD123_1686 [Bacteroidota bacterium]
MDYTITFSSDLGLFFFNQFQTIGIYSFSEKKFKHWHKLYDIASEVPVCERIKISGDVLSISAVTAPQDPSDPSSDWIPYFFGQLADAGDCWLEGAEIVIGMGDIRGGVTNITIDRYALNSAKTVYMTSSGPYCIKILEV